MTATSSARRTIPCHLISGPLGVGKTTAILSYLQRHAGRQRVGVLVNDVGPMGLDGESLRAEAPGTAIRNVPGGCICCTLYADLSHHLQQLAADPNIDRLIIEPSGLASPAQVIDLLRSHARDLNLDVRPVIVMLDAARFHREMYQKMPYFQVLCESADILVFNRTDKAAPAKIEECLAFARELDPPKCEVIATQRGELPDRVFEAAARSAPPGPAIAFTPVSTDQSTVSVQPDAPNHGHDPRQFAGGLLMPADTVFDEDRLMANLLRICHQGIDGTRVIRLKGIFHTTGGWQAYHIANQEVSMRESSHRRDCRLDWISEPAPIDVAAMRAALMAPASA
jgi:G3E family GTPase